MSPDRMRIEIARAYPGMKNRLMAMSDNQTVAIYRRLQTEGKIK